MMKSRILFFCAAVFVLVLNSPTFATTKTWIGPAGGDFHDGANWNPAGVPASGDVALIGGGSSVVWSNAATIQAAVTVASGGTLSFASSVNKFFSGKITNSGTINVQGTGGLFAQSGAPIYNEVGGLFDIQTNAEVRASSGAPFFQNDGTLRKSAGTGTGRILVPLTNSATVEALVGTLEIRNSDLGGTFTAAVGAAIVFNGTYEITTLPVTGGAGSVDFGSTAQIHFAVPITNFTLRNGSLFGTNIVSGTLTWADGGINNKLTIAPGGVLNVISNTTKFFTAIITNSGTINIQGPGDLFAQSGAPIYNEAGGLFDIQTNVDLQISSGAPFFRNVGTLRKSAGTGTARILVPLTNSNSGTIEVQRGTLNITNPIQAAGQTVLNGGTISVSQPFQLQGGTLGGTNTLTGNVNNTGGTITPGLSPGRFNITGSYTQAVGGTLQIELAGTTAETALDRFVVSGTAALGGTLSAILTNGYYPGTNASFGYLTAGSVVGTFSNFDFSSNSVGMEVRYTATTSTIVVTNVRPSATNTTLGVARGSAVSIPAAKLLLNTADPDLHALNVTGAGTASHGNASVGGGFLSYTASPTYSGMDSFTYVVGDPGGLTATGAVNVVVYDAAAGPNVLTVTSGSGTASVKIAGIPGAIYRLQYTTDLSNPNWQEVVGSDAAVSNTGIVTLTDPSATDPQRFYRTLYVSGP